MRASAKHKEQNWMLWGCDYFLAVNVTSLAKSTEESNLASNLELLMYVMLQKTQIQDSTPNKTTLEIWTHCTTTERSFAKTNRNSFKRVCFSGGLAAFRLSRCFVSSQSQSWLKQCVPFPAAHNLPKTKDQQGESGVVKSKQWKGKSILVHCRLSSELN